MFLCVALSSALCNVNRAILSYILSLIPRFGAADGFWGIQLLALSPVCLLSLSRSLSLSLTRSVSVSVSPSFSPYISLCLSLFISLYFYISLPLLLSLSLSLSLSLCLSVSPSCAFSLSLSLLIKYFFLCLPTGILSTKQNPVLSEVLPAAC